MKTYRYLLITYELCTLLRRNLHHQILHKQENPLYVNVLLEGENLRTLGNCSTIQRQTNAHILSPLE